MIVKMEACLFNENKTCQGNSPLALCVHMLTRYRPWCDKLAEIRRAFEGKTLEVPS